MTGAYKDKLAEALKTFEQAKAILQDGRKQSRDMQKVAELVAKAKSLQAEAFRMKDIEEFILWEYGLTKMAIGNRGAVLKMGDSAPEWVNLAKPDKTERAKCAYCGKWGKARSECMKCGAPIDPSRRRASGGFLGNDEPYLVSETWPQIVTAI